MNQKKNRATVGDGTARVRLGQYRKNKNRIDRMKQYIERVIWPTLSPTKPPECMPNRIDSRNVHPKVRMIPNVSQRMKIGIEDNVVTIVENEKIGTDDRIINGEGKTEEQDDGP